MVFIKHTAGRAGSACGDASNSSICEAGTSKKRSRKTALIRNPLPSGRGGRQSECFYRVSKKISEFIERLITEGLKAFLKTYIGHAFLNKIVDVAVNHLDKAVIDPIVDVLVIKISKNFDISRARKTIERLEKARNELNREDYNRHVDDLLGGL